MDRLDKKYGLFLFDSTSIALRAEQLIKSARVSCMVIPTPVEFSSGCGISLLVDEDALDKSKQALEGCEGHRVLYPYVRQSRKD
ncbi:MAG: DUF3343 domain-containing protein [Candidatus Geothermincolia bacterium]